MTEKDIFVSYIKTLESVKSILTFYFEDIKPAKKTASCYGSALKIKVNCRFIRHYSRYIHAQRQNNLFSSVSVSVSCRRNMASVCDGFDSLSVWLEHTSFKRGDKPSDFDGFLGNISQRACIPLSCGGTDRGWPNNLPIPSQEMQRWQKTPKSLKPSSLRAGSAVVSKTPVKSTRFQL